MKKPQIDESVFVAAGARIIGDVTIGKDSSVWYNAVIRGDHAPIKIGERTNIQDNCVLHTTFENGIQVGSEVIVGHSAILHGCTIGNHSLIGMGAIIMNGAEIGEDSVVGAGALVPNGRKYPPRSLILGTPAKVVRDVTEQDLAGIDFSAQEYMENASEQKNLDKEYIISGK